MIRLFEDKDSLARGVAAVFSECISVAVETRGRCGILLAGGETPLRSYRLLTAEPFVSSLPWSSVHLFWGDERCVPAGDPRNNAGTALKLFNGQLPVPSYQIHPVRSELPPELAATDYEQQLRQFFGGEQPVFDLVLLGLGEDGHTASLFPGKPVYDEGRWTAVTRRQGEIIERVTLTPSILNLAARVVFMVSGRSKAQVLNDALFGRYEPERLPARLIRPLNCEPEWLADREACSVLLERCPDCLNSLERSA